MPPLTRLFIKTGLLYFVSALGLGCLLYLRPLSAVWPWLAGATPVYFHLFMVGWITHLIIGVAYWMFPRHTREHPRGSERLAWSVYWLLNSGLLMRTFIEPRQSMAPTTAGSWLLVMAALLQWLGGVAFVINTWPRVKER